VILRVAWAIAAKDLRLEVRSRSAASAVLPFAATILLALGFALGPNRLLLEQTAPGLLWLAGLFASVELCHRSYQAEAANGAFVQLMVLFAITTGMVVVLFGMPVGPAPGRLLLTAALGIAGLSAMGALLGLLAVQGRTRQAALPVIVLPLVTPVVIAATRATGSLTQGSLAGVDGWLGLLAAFDVAFLAAGYLVFGNLLED
jgi:heme exporter protein B